jgi:hypothetical protein
MEYGDATPDLAFFKYALRAAIRLSAVVGADAEKRPVWQAIVSHLPMYTADEVVAPDRAGAALSPESARYPAAPTVAGYETVLGAIGRQGGQIQIHSCASGSDWNASLDACALICSAACEARGEEDAESAQTLGRLQPFLAALPQECTGQLASFGPT